MSQRAERRGFVVRPSPRLGEAPRRPQRRAFARLRERRASSPLMAAHARRRVAARQVAVVLGGAVCAALLLVVLRIDSIRLRYRLADALRAEQQLQEQQSKLVVDVRRLRHPLRLAELGRGLGLVRPERVIELAAAAGPR